MRGADVVIGALRQAGLDTIFTLSGNHVMAVFDAAIGQGVRLIHTRHEAAAVSMADAYARMTGTVGIALVTGGAGHVNALGALCTARAGETPLLLLSGHAPHGELGKGAFQELDQVALAAPLTKASWMAQSAAGLGADIARGLRIARSGRPGPVHISLPSDVLDDAAPKGMEPNDKAARDVQGLEPALADAAMAMLRTAERPVIIVPPALCTTAGRHVLKRLATLGIPVIPMESPRGLDDPALGGVRQVLRTADLVVLRGKALDFTLGFGADSISPGRWIVIDPEPAMLERAARLLPTSPALSAQADPQAAIEALLALGDGTILASAAWRDRVSHVLADRRTAMMQAASARLNSATLCAAIDQFMRRLDNPILIADGGEIGQWAQALIAAPDRIINGVAGAIGPSIPFAIGAKAAAPARPVLAVLGDGTFGFHMAEFETAARLGLNFIAVIGNDGWWNAERQLQIRRYGAERAIGCELDRATRYDQVAVALGGHGELVETLDDIGPALQRALAANRPACLNVLIDGLSAPKMAVQ
jgi:acetolactate synthase-1/2/3 large subunit